MSRSEPRGGAWLATGEEVVAAAQDRRRSHTVHEPEMDWCSLPGAQELARRITRHWAERGVAVECRVVPVGFAVFAVRSDVPARFLREVG